MDENLNNVAYNIKYSWIDLQKSDKDSYYDINVSPSDGKIQRK